MAPSAAAGFDRQLADALSKSSARGSGDLRINTKVSADPVRGNPAPPAPAPPAPAAPAPAPATPPSAGNPFAAQSPPLTPAEASRLAEPKQTAWSPWAGPRDSRDALPFGGGLTTASGAPKIAENSAAARNQYNYAGPGAKNPYFTNPGNPLREGYVSGFNNWFLSNPAILGPNQKSTAANPIYFSTEEGAQEALRLVQQHDPGAQLTSRTWGGGPFLSNKPVFYVTLPSGKELNAGGILEGYYNRGFGVSVSSDVELERSVRLA